MLAAAVGVGRRSLGSQQPGGEVMTIELKYLTLVTTLTALIWIPYILNEIMVRGVLDAVGYPENPKPLAHGRRA